MRRVAPQTTEVIVVEHCQSFVWKSAVPTDDPYVVRYKEVRGNCRARAVSISVYYTS